MDVSEESKSGSVAKEVAQAEVTSWLDFKKISEQKRLKNKSSVEALVDAIIDGSLSLNNDQTFTHQLKFPVKTKEGESTFSQLVYKPRIKMADVHTKLQMVKSDDADGRVACYISALCSLPLAVIKELDSEDYGIGQSVAIFFL